MHIKKLFFITIILLHALSVSNAFSATFNKGDLVIVIYNEQAKEVAVPLGSISAIDFSQQNYTLLAPGEINLEMFQVDEWSQLRVAFWGGLRNIEQEIFNVYFALRKETAPILSLKSYTSFLDTADGLYSYYSINSDSAKVYFIGNSVTPKGESYDETMNSNSTAPGYFAGLNSDSREFGESDLTALTSTGYVDMYFYRFINTSLDKGPDESSDYTAVLRINVDGSVVLNPPSAVNQAPEVSNIPDQTIDEGSSFITVNLDNYVDDPDDDDADITWTYSGNSMLAVGINQRVATITTPGSDWYGSETITFIATDPSGESDSDDVVFTVTNINDDPVVSDIPDQSIIEGNSFEAVHLDQYVNDIDNDDSEIIWSHSGENELSVNIADRVATITAPSSDWTGSETITFTASDPDNKSDSTAVVFTVVDSNMVPEISGLSDQSVNEGESFNLIDLDDYVSDNDHENSQLTWSYSGNNSLVVSIDGNNILTVTAPGPDWFGSETIGLTVTDPDGNSDSANVLFVVNPVNDAPVVQSPGGQEIEDGGYFSSFDLDDYVTDVDNDVSEITWSYSGNTKLSVTIDAGNNNNVTITRNDQTWIGSEEITFTAADPSGEEDSFAASYTVNPSPPTAPGLNSPEDGSEITANQPMLSVNNSYSKYGNVLTYGFELGTEPSFATPVIRVDGIAEGVNITLLSLEDKYPELFLDENTEYYWRVKAYDGNLYSEWMTTSSFFVNAYNEAPGKPAISSPSNNSEVDSLQPTLEITNGSDPDGDDLIYKFELYDTVFSDNLNPGVNPILSKSVIEESDGTTSWTAGGDPADNIDLEDNTSYWWRVMAVDEDGLNSDWIGPFMFIVNHTNDTPSRPGLYSPEANSEVNEYTPELIIENSTDEDYDAELTYEFQIDVLETFNSSDGEPIETAVVDENSSGYTSWIPSELTENVTYYWRVRASDGFSESSWLTASFIVNGTNESPATPVLRYPDDEVTVNSSSLILKSFTVTDPDGDEVSYVFEVCRMGGSCSTSDSLSEPEWKLDGLKNNAEYQWAVKAVDEHSVGSSWSDPRYFSVITNYAPTPPKLNNPVSGGTVFSESPVILSVKNSTDDDKDDLNYGFEIYTDQTLSELVESGYVEEGNIITEYEVLTDLDEDVVYYWRAIASDGENMSSYSSTFNFIVSSEEPEVEVDVIESRMIYSSMLEALKEDETYDITVEDNTSDLDGVTISIPKGALDSNINLTIGEATKTPAFPSGVSAGDRVIHFGPEGTVFNVPVTIKVPYTQSDLDDSGTDDPLDLKLYTYGSSTGWEVLEAKSADKTNNILEYEVSHFSIFAFGISSSTDQSGDSDQTAPASGGGGGGCFIATAGYENNNSTCSLSSLFNREPALIVTWTSVFAGILVLISSVTGRKRFIKK